MIQVEVEFGEAGFSEGRENEVEKTCNKARANKLNPHA